MITPESFRTDWPAFKDANVYPDPQVQYWINMAGIMMQSARWGNASTQVASPPTTLKDMATELFVAHNLTLFRKDELAQASGAVPGAQQGPTNSESVGPVSVSYSAEAGLEPNAGHWNLSVYGTRFIRLARQIAMGPIQVSGPFVAPPYSGPAWGGPFVWGGAGPNGGTS